MDKVSVIIPVYNVREYLSRCIDSVLAQTHANLEIILVDDGSTDGSGEICDRYAERDTRISVIHKSNGGLSSARNAALDVITGDYVMFVDSDDYIAEGMTGLLISANADMSLCGYAYVDENGNLTPQENVSFTSEVLTKSEYWKYFYTDTRIYYVTMWAKLFKRELWDDVRFPLNKLHEDEFVIHLLVEKCERIATSKQPCYYYFTRGGSIMNSGYKEKNLDAAEGMLIRCGYFIDKKNYPLALTTLEMASYSIAKGYGFLGYSDRVRELSKMQRGLLAKLLFKRSGAKSKLKCALFALSIKLFSSVTKKAARSD